MIQSTAQTLQPIVGTLVSICNLVVLLYAFKKFLGKPHATLAEEHKALEKRVDAQQEEIEKIKKCLEKDDDTFSDQKELNEVFINCMLAFIDVQRGYCASTGYTDTGDLERARKMLQEYLARK